MFVHVDLATLQTGCTRPGSTCRIDGIGPVDVDHVRSLLGEAFVVALIEDGVDVRNVVHLGRQVTAHQRSALEARGYHCEVPGCAVSYGLEIDHRTDWALTRTTTLDELVWLCAHHHDQKTHHGHRLTGPPGDRPGPPPPTAHPPTSRPLVRRRVGWQPRSRSGARVGSLRVGSVACRGPAGALPFARVTEPPPFDLTETDRLLSTTRAVRRRLDLDRPVDPGVIVDCIRLAVQAPTGSNEQGWRWMIVTDGAKRAEIARLYKAAGAAYLEQAAQTTEEPQTRRVYESAWP